MEIARTCFSEIEDPAQYTITVRVAKPAALRFADAPEISITRRASDYPCAIENAEPSRYVPFILMFYMSDLFSSVPQTSKTHAVIALGANLGDRFQNIELALRYLDDCSSLYPKGDHISGEISVLSTSFLYETAPMYVEDQPSFINCACLVSSLDNRVSKISLIYLGGDECRSARAIGGLQANRICRRKSPKRSIWAKSGRLGYRCIRRAHHRHKNTKRKGWSRKPGGTSGRPTSSNVRKGICIKTS